MLRNGDKFDGLEITSVWDACVEVREGGVLKYLRRDEVEARRKAHQERTGAVPDEQQG